MRVCKCLGLVLFLALFGINAEGHDQASSVKLVRLKLANFSVELREFAAKGYDIAGVNLSDQTVDLLVDGVQFLALSVTDGVDIVAEDAVPTWIAPDQRYHNAQEVGQELAEFATRFPEITHLRSLGKSGEGRDIWAIKISDNAGTSEASEPKILFNAMHHAREVMTTEVAMDTVELLLNKYGQDPKVTAWVDENEIWVVPMVNPDGNNKVWTSNNMWRKNNRGGHGVDINRNYPFKWGTCNGSSGSTYSETYRGPSAGSEPEAQALMALVAAVKPAFDISYHSYSELVLYPYGCQGARTETRDIVEGVGKEMARLLPSDSGRGTYTPGTPWELLYSVDGGDIDWMYGTHQVIPYVIELNSSSLGFQPNFSYRNPTVEKARAAWGMLLDRLGASGIHGTVEGSFVGLKVHAKNMASGAETMTYGVAPDGSFHMVLAPGMYEVFVNSAKAPIFQEKVIVGDALVRIKLINRT